jgi:hypothetical protein
MSEISEKDKESLAKIKIYFQKRQNEIYKRDIRISEFKISIDKTFSFLKYMYEKRYEILLNNCEVVFNIKMRLEKISIVIDKFMELKTFEHSNKYIQCQTCKNKKDIIHIEGNGYNLTNKYHFKYNGEISYCKIEDCFVLNKDPLFNITEIKDTLFCRIQYFKNFNINEQLVNHNPSLIDLIIKQIIKNKSFKELTLLEKEIPNDMYTKLLQYSNLFRNNK